MMRLAIAACLLLITASAFAADPKDRREVENVVPAVTELEFGAVDVNASVVKPNVAWVNQLRHLEFDSMVKLRKDFAPEMKSSVAEIR